MSLEKAIESQIQEAMATGLFDNLPGAGRPLPLEGNENDPNWLGHHLLRNAGVLPRWLDLAREIEHDLRRLQQIDDDHRLLCDHARATGDWEAHRLAIGHARQRYETLARDIRRRQDRLNLEAPGIRSERPGLWVEYHLERLDARLPAPPETRPAADDVIP
ncbi:DUF1992 domain-containing protein [Tepidiforma sp.]|uniref:DnaJ family domain-containing protein n=1 Tax=Tepidiforma sp. TaxID=2682230 RepID=UPI002ADDE439|nr:DUF1992 domain-containing protein [Tepidiforma sp.]